MLKNMTARPRTDEELVPLFTYLPADLVATMKAAAALRRMPLKVYLREHFANFYSVDRRSMGVTG